MHATSKVDVLHVPFHWWRFCAVFIIMICCSTLFFSFVESNTPSVSGLFFCTISSCFVWWKAHCCPRSLPHKSMDCCWVAPIESFLCLPRSMSHYILFNELNNELDTGVVTDQHWYTLTWIMYFAENIVVLKPLFVMPCDIGVITVTTFPILVYQSQLW